MKTYQVKIAADSVRARPGFVCAWGEGRFGWMVGIVTAVNTEGVAFEMDVGGGRRVALGNGLKLVAPRSHFRDGVMACIGKVYPTAGAAAAALFEHTIDDIRQQSTPKRVRESTAVLLRRFSSPTG